LPADYDYTKKDVWAVLSLLPKRTLSASLSLSFGVLAGNDACAAMDWVVAGGGGWWLPHRVVSLRLTGGPPPFCWAGLCAGLGAVLVMDWGGGQAGLIGLEIFGFKIPIRNVARAIDTISLSPTSLGLRRALALMLQLDPSKRFASLLPLPPPPTSERTSSCCSLTS
jgi:hypothetical protein